MLGELAIRQMTMLQAATDISVHRNITAGK
jgi:hypothetical protein